MSLEIRNIKRVTEIDPFSRK